MNPGKVIRFLLNKYLLASVAFVVWMIFFDTNSLLTRHKLQRNLQELQQEKQFYLEEIMKDSILNQKLIHDSATIEQYAREHYLMRRPGEDVFLITDTTKK